MFSLAKDLESHDEAVCVGGLAANVGRGNMSRVVVVNQHTNNFGDDAAGVALLGSVCDQLDATEIDVFYIWHGGTGQLPFERPDVTVRHHVLEELSGLQDFRARLAAITLTYWARRKLRNPGLAQLTRAASEADFVFVSPAGANIGIYKDWTYLLVLTLLILSGTRPIFMQNTVGPSNSRLFNRLATFVLRRSELTVREKASQDWLASKGLSSYLGVDTAVLLDDADRDEPISDAPYIAVIPTRLSNWHRDFRNEDEGTLWQSALVEALASASRDRGQKVVVVPHLYGPHAERKALAEFAKTLVDAGVRASIAQVETLSDYRSVVEEASVVVSMRYHGLILSAMRGVPCVALCYENKMVEAAEYLGVAEYAMLIRDITPARLTAAFARSAADAERLSEQASQRRDLLRTIARGPLLSARSRTLRSAAEASNGDTSA